MRVAIRILPALLCVGTFAPRAPAQGAKDAGRGSDSLDRLVHAGVGRGLLIN